MNVLLKRLEIQGFKSFAAKTVFELPARIVGVVGPNGSGKSNIVDALRWVLGERGAKNLRGESAENLIFAGTPKRPAASVARVGLIFENTAHLFPFETTEVALERRMERGDTSESFVNGAETRLKDITALLARARLGTRGLTIISQGQSDLFVRSTPKERRIMVEEVLGLKEFRLKKEEAERRLETVRDNLSRAGATCEELLPRLKMLRREKTKWERRGEVEKDLRALEDAYFGHHFSALISRANALEGPSRELRRAEEEARRTMAAAEARVRSFGTDESVNVARKKIREEEQAAFEARRTIEREIVRLETRIELNAVPASPASPEGALETLRAVHRELRRALELDSVEAIRAKIAHVLETVADYAEHAPRPARRTEEHAAHALLAPLREKLQGLDAALEALKVRERALETREKETNKTLQKEIDALEAARQSLGAVQHKLQTLTLEKEKLRLQKEELEREWRAAGRAGEKPPEFREDAGPETDWRKVEERMHRRRSELSVIGEIDPETAKEADTAEERYAFLEKEIADLERASNDLSGLIKELETRIHDDFKVSFKKMNEAFDTYFSLMFGGGKAKLALEKASVPATDEEGSEARATLATRAEEAPGIEVEVSIPRKKIKNLDMLSGGEKSLVSMAALFALISISAPPFLVLDEIDAALDEENARRFAELVKRFSRETQFIIVTHNRITMEIADILYGITMGDDGVSKVLSLKLDEGK